MGPYVWVPFGSDKNILMLSAKKIDRTRYVEWESKILHPNNVNAYESFMNVNALISCTRPLLRIASIHFLFR